MLDIKFRVGLKYLRNLGVNCRHTENSVVKVICDSLVLISVPKKCLFLELVEDEASAHIGFRTRNCLVVGQLV